MICPKGFFCFDKTTIILILIGFIIVVVQYIKNTNSQNNILKKDEQFQKRMQYVQSLNQEIILKESKIICKFCNEAGSVQTTKKEKKEVSREKGLIGATIGRKSVTIKRVTNLKCSNCGMEWDA